MGGMVRCIAVTYKSFQLNPIMNLTVHTAWVIVEEENLCYLVDGILYPSVAEATQHLSQKYKWKVVTLEEHMRAVYELGLSEPSFM
jgi:hypothetical protein